MSHTVSREQTHVRASDASPEHRQFVVDLERLRELGVAGQPEQSHAWLAPHPSYVGHCVIVEPAGQLNLLVGCSHALERRGADCLVLLQLFERHLAQGQLEGLRQIALDGLTGGVLLGVGLNLE